MKFPKIHITPKWRRILLRAGLTIIAALVLTFFLEWRHFIGDTERTWRFVNETRRVFLYSAGIMGLALLLLSAIFRKPWTSIGIMTALIIVVGFVHISKYTQRANPLLPEDFQMTEQVGTLTNFVDMGALIRTIVAVVLVAILTILLNRWTGKYFLREKSEAPKSWWRRHDVGLRIALAIFAIMGLAVSTDFARNHHGQKYEDVRWLNTYFVAWNQSYNYELNGFILGFLYNLGKLELQAPDGYTEEKIAEIADKYTAEATQANAKRKALADADYNIIVILNESFYDPSIIRDYYHYEGDVTPEWHKIAQRYPSGQMYSLDYGGGTANIEFEVFTGLSNYWADTVPYTDILPKLSAVQAIASFAKQNGYETIGIHPYNGGMYKRNYALAKQGFDEFITEKEMDFTEREQNAEGDFGEITDRSAYSQVLKVLTERENRQMVGLITMQNHAPYVSDWYDSFDFAVTAEDANEDDLAKASAFLQVLHRSDKYLGEFIQELNNLDEKTVVLFYGDHSPGVFSAVSLDESQEVKNLSRLTPYFIYANFDLPSQSSLANLNLPTTTPNCLVNTMYDLLNLEKPALNYLLDKICAQTPILSRFYLGEAGPFQSTELSEYEMVSYDVLGGKQYWYQYTAKD